MKTLELLLGSLVFMGLAAGVGRAADNAAGVGRVSAVVGPVQYQSTGGGWADALVNEPVAVGTSLRAAQGAEAELRGPGVHIALAPASELRVLRFDGDALQIDVLTGRIGIHLDAAGAAKTLEIDLPHGGVWLAAPGDYDIAAGDAQVPAAVQVFAGKARLGGGLDDRYIVAAAADAFSDWWRSQDDNTDLAARPQLEIAGVAALDAAGRWEPNAQYGRVWFPSDIAADWTPYRDGAWRFLPPWGWTWIDAAPWGFAPSHYGRWARIDDRWGWIPGAPFDAADYSPAVVAFLGTAGIGLSRPGDFNAPPAIAWFPLGPGEAVGDGNEANYQNRRFATAVPRAVFASGLSVANALVDDVPTQRFADAPVILRALDIPPVAFGAVVTAAPRKPVAVAVAAPMPARKAVVVAQRVAPARDVGKRLRLATAVALRSRPLASTSAFHPGHNRQHLAATRGGA
jgi:hypothetical protein